MLCECLKDYGRAGSKTGSLVGRQVVRRRGRGMGGVSSLILKQSRAGSSYLISLSQGRRNARTVIAKEMKMLQASD